MSDYTPTTEDVSRIYMLARHAEDASLKSDPDNSDALDEFHRWYAAEKRKWQAEALREAASVGMLHYAATHHDSWSRGRDVISGAFLRDRAASLDAKIGGGHE